MTDNGRIRTQEVNKDEPSKIENVGDLFSNIEVSLLKDMSERKDGNSEKITEENKETNQSM